MIEVTNGDTHFVQQNILYLVLLEIHILYYKHEIKSLISKYRPRARCVCVRHSARPQGCSWEQHEDGSWPHRAFGVSLHLPVGPRCRK